ncbi:MAG: cellulase family glycosylhydrolase [Bacteroidales bacterium]|nr:cellulase family glycosylhydrolase [Bacteroidales bacterium]
MMKKVLLLVLCVMSVPFCLTARDQWSVKRAQKWEQEVGVLKGANGYYMTNPALGDPAVMKKLHELGFNSVRAWIGGNTAEDIIAALEKLLDAADDYGVTVSPVLSLSNLLRDPLKDKENEPVVKEILTDVLRHFRGNRQIVYWDLWNEPPYNPKNADVLRGMDILEKMVLWGREANATQPLTSSIFWDSNNEDRDNDVFRRRLQVESMMDIHNYHDYTTGVKDGEYSRRTIHMLKSLDGRPIVCSECLNRQNGSGIERSLSIFAEEHVHFYVWGLYANDRNWNTRWRKSEFDAYARNFHNMLYADGTPYSEQEVQWVKDFRFCAPGESMDPGTEVTERWQIDRIWRRMSLGPVKGFVGDDPGAVPEGYNCVKVAVSYQDWRKDAEALYANFENCLKAAGEKGLLVVPVLLTEKDGHDEGHAAYVNEFILRFAHAPEVFAWDICEHPSDAEAVRHLFRSARSCQSTHPVFMVPTLTMKPFPDGFDYRAAMVHGKTNGWTYFNFRDKAQEWLCAEVWNLSDVIAFGCPFRVDQAGWIGAVARRYGRPVFAFLEGKPAGDPDEVLKLLSSTQLYWWTGEDLGADRLASFRFIPFNDWAE